MDSIQAHIKQLVALNQLTAHPPAHAPAPVHPEVVVRDKAGKVAGKMKGGKFYKAVRTPDGAVAGIEGDG